MANRVAVRVLIIVALTAIGRAAIAATPDGEIVCTGDPLAQHMTFLHERFDRRAAQPIEFGGKLHRDFLKTLAPQLGDYEAGSMAEAPPAPPTTSSTLISTR